FRRSSSACSPSRRAARADSTLRFHSRSCSAAAPSVARRPRAREKPRARLRVALRPSMVVAWARVSTRRRPAYSGRSEEHTSELQAREKLGCRLLVEKKKFDAHLYMKFKL